MPNEIVIRLLGDVSVELDGAAVHFATHKEAALLAYLVCTGRPHTRTAIAELLWGDRAPEQVSGNVRTTLSRLHHAVGPFLSLAREWVAFDPQAGRHWLDSAEFAAHLGALHSWRGRAEELPRAAAHRLVQALRLYRGDFLAGLRVRGADAFQAWAAAERERLRGQAVDALHQLSAFYLRRGRYAEGIASVNQLLALSPLDEAAQRQMLLLLAASGQRSAALAHYEGYRRLLALEPGREPSAEMQALHVRLRTPGGDAGLGGSPRPRACADDLPLAMTPLVGRREELGLLRQRLLDPTARLVTVVGMGGVGKTRLALAAAEEVQGDFAHGACFVPLTGAAGRSAGRPAGDPLILAVARALRVPFAPGQEPRAQLLGYLRQKELLLILDDIEELLDAGVGLILEVLRSAPYVTILVTSRQRLNLQAEHAVRIAGLAVPPEGAAPPAGWDGVSPYPFSSVQLFAEQARRVQARFALDRENLADVFRICRLAEGLPLAIELAAAWVEEMDCAAIAQSIQEGLDLLATTQRDVEERHRSMRAVLEGSWQLLAEDERRVLAQAAVFSGAFTREAAAAVLGATPGMLAALEERSLLRRSEAGRYALHTLVRQFAGEQLAHLPAVESALHARHSAYYLDRLAGDEGALRGPEPRQAAAEIQRDWVEVQQAWRWAGEWGPLERLNRASGALARFLRLVGLYREGHDLLGWTAERLRGQAGREAQRGLARSLVEQAGLLIPLGEYRRAAELAQEGAALAAEEREPAVAADGCARWGSALLLLGEYPAAREHLERAVELAQAAASPAVEAECRRRLGLLERDLGNDAAARAQLQRALDLFTASGDRDGAGVSLDNLGIVASDQADYAAAQACYEEALLIFEQTGYRLGQVSVRTNLGCLQIRLGDYARAEATFAQALHALREMGGRMGEALLLNNLGNAALFQGNYEAAQDDARQAVMAARESAERLSEGYALDLLGHVSSGLRQYQSAAAAYLEALAVWEELGQPNLAMESLAGLARVGLATGDLAQAQDHVARIMAYIDEVGAIRGTDEDVLIYLTCYRVLHAAGDVRAGPVLATAYHLVQERAGQIGDEALRQSFLESVAVHREVVEAWAGHE